MVYLKMLSSTAFLLLSIIASVYGDVTQVCTEKDACTSYLDIAMDMISKAKYETCRNCMKKVVDCADILRMGYNKSGIYEIWPMNRLTERKPLSVYCDMNTNGGGWTVIQRRGDFQRAKDYFFQDWKSYKEGFGDVEKDFWLGNDNIFALTNQKLYSVRFDLKAVDQSRRFALYDKFWIDDESNKYTLHISDFSGDAGDSMANHNNQKFSTKDQDNDIDKNRHCAVICQGGWWYHDCRDSNLNGLYHKGKSSTADGVHWRSFKGFGESLEWTEIKVRPKHFKSYVTDVPHV